MRRYMRRLNLGDAADPEIAAEVGMEPEEMEEMFRMVAIGDYDERYVIPKRHGEVSPDPLADQGSCGIDFAGPPAPAAVAAPAEPVPDDFDLRDYLSEGGNGRG
jgi:nitrate reductase beta subunit